MKTRNLIATSSLALTMMLGIVATPLSAQQTYTPGVTVEKNTNPEGKQTIRNLHLQR